MTTSLIAIAAVMLTGAGPGGEDSSLKIDAAKVVNHVSRLMYGSCIEDVNHEIYGGLYAQLIFGESFEEPPRAVPPLGWSAYGGRWRVDSGVLAVGADF